MKTLLQQQQQDSSHQLFQLTNLRINLTEKRGDKTRTVNVEPVNKNLGDVNKQQKKQGNLIPTEYRKVFWTMLGSQQKFDKGTEKVIAKLDELDQQRSTTIPPMTVNEATH